jgi:succinate dehydrogenase hydrophobic anchor subunit
MKKSVSNSSKKELAKFIAQLIAAIASAILTALGASACVLP